MGWPVETYLQGDHPLQQEITRRVAELLGLPPDELIAERDDCGAPTLRLQLDKRRPHTAPSARPNGLVICPSGLIRSC